MYKFQAVKNKKPGVENTEGFTLIELIIYIGIVSIILTSISYLVLDIMGSRSKAYAYLEAEQNFRFIEETVTRDIKSADGFSLSGDQTLILASGTDVITFTFDPSKKITRRKNGGSAVDVSTDEVEVTGSFIDFSFLGRSRHIKVHIEINNKNTDNVSDFSASRLADFAVELRKRR